MNECCIQTRHKKNEKGRRVRACCSKVPCYQPRTEGHDPARRGPSQHPHRMDPHQSTTMPEVAQVQPFRGSCTATVTCTGLGFGSQHTPDLDRCLHSSSGRTRSKSLHVLVGAP